MGFLNSLVSTATQNTMSNVNSFTQSISPSMLITGNTSFASVNNMTNLVSGSLHGTLSGILGVDPSCQDKTGEANGTVTNSNDPCGGARNELANAVLGLGMELAGPSINAAGVFLGNGLNAGLGASSSFFGDGVTAVAGSVGTFFGASDSTKSLMARTLGTGVEMVLDRKDISIAGLGAKAINNVSASIKIDSSTKCSWSKVVSAAFGF